MDRLKTVLAYHYAVKQEVELGVAPSPLRLRWGFAPFLMVIASGCVGDFFTDPDPPELTPASLQSITLGATSQGGFTCGLGLDGLALCWGTARWGVLGDGSFSGVRAIADSVPGGLRFRSLSAGAGHVCGVTVQGTAYCWGNNAAAQLGSLPLGDERSRILEGDPFIPTPVPVGTITFESLSAGAVHTCALTAGGTVHCWGANFTGALGAATSEVCAGFSSFLQAAAPCSGTPVLASGGLSFASVSAGGLFTGSPGSHARHRNAVESSRENHTCGVTTNGDAYCWGANADGQLGVVGQETCDASFRPCSASPQLVSGGLKYALVSAGFNHTCGITTDGRAYCWGNNGAFQLGTDSMVLQVDVFGDTVLVPASGPNPLPVAGNLRFETISAGSVHTCGVATDGTAYCWGVDQGGQLGTDNLETESGFPNCRDATTQAFVFCHFARFPTPVMGGLSFESVTTGQSHTCGVARDGSAYCWGNNESGQLGDGSVVSSTQPVRVMQNAARTK